MDLTLWFSLAVAPFLSSWNAFSLPKYFHLGLLWCAVSCLCYSYLYNHQRMLFCLENKESWNNYDLRKVFHGEIEVTIKSDSLAAIVMGFQCSSVEGNRYN